MVLGISILKFTNSVGIIPPFLRELYIVIVCLTCWSVCLFILMSHIWTTISSEVFRHLVSEPALKWISFKKIKECFLHNDIEHINNHMLRLNKTHDFASLLCWLDLSHFLQCLEGMTLLALFTVFVSYYCN